MAGAPVKKESITQNYKSGSSNKEGYAFGIYFLLAIILFYLILALLKPDRALEALKTSGEILIGILPVMLVVLFFMGMLYRFVTPKTVRAYVGTGSGLKG